uniref:VWFA domain-containing protein n=1 Tax=Plectus sambesii TaxID=2011161 RepID=A0A914VHM6_9BILA
MTLLSSCPPRAPLVALLISLFGCYGYCILFHRAVEGFSAQLSTLLSTEEFKPHLFVYLVAITLTSAVAFFYMALSRCPCAIIKCGDLTTASERSPTVAACDFVLVVDQSASIVDNDYKLAKKFAADLTLHMRIGQAKSKSQVGMVLFDRSAQVAFYLNSFTSNAAVYDAIMSAGQSRGLTNIASGMNMALDEVFTTAHGNRTSARNIMFVITDGSDNYDVLAAQKRAAQRGIAIFALGVGKSVNMQQLLKVTGEAKNVIMAPNFDSLHNMLPTVCAELADTTGSGKTSTVGWTKCCKCPSPLFGSSLRKALLILISYCVLISWVLLLCFTAIATALYTTFIYTIYSFCASIDDQCFDFTVFKPAFSHMMTDKNAAIIFCQDKKEALCSTEFDCSGRFIAAFIMCLIALIGLINLLTCMVTYEIRPRQDQIRSSFNYYEGDGRGKKYSLVMNVKDG